MEPPVTYQGGKQRIASAIVDRIQPKGRFYDLCCGTGAVSIELVNRGYAPQSITMIDAGPWGLFWRSIGCGEFDADRMREWCNRVPADRSQVKGFMESLSAEPPGGDAVYVFLLLQASAFGGKAIWIEGDRWKNCSFRSYWKPTATSSRRSPVNPMMPMPETLHKRVCEVAVRMRGVSAECCRIEGVENEIKPGDTAYIDPPYGRTTGYGHQVDAASCAGRIRSDCLCFRGSAAFAGS